MNSLLKKISASLGIVAIFACLMLVLTRPAEHSFVTTSYMPELSETPLYVEVEPNRPVCVQFTPHSACHVSSMELLLVNLSQESRGSIRVSVINGSNELLLGETIPVDSITPGAWYSVATNMDWNAKETYELVIEADQSNPYLMQVDQEVIRHLPFTEAIYQADEMVETAASVGYSISEEKQMTYGDIFYFSIPLSCLICLMCMLLVWLGKDRCVHMVSSVPVKKLLNGYGTEAFMILLFLVQALDIYVKAYRNGIYISSDSSNYLREAVNLRAGYGFSYDGLAGYHTWFASWPILYPAFIALVMLCTGTGAYLASKILTVVLLGAILLVLYLTYKKDAWIYALVTTNLGFLTLTYYTWSEVLFILELVLFALILGYIVKQEAVRPVWYVLLGVSATAAFLTRYFGLFLWAVLALYLAAYLFAFLKNKDRKILRKIHGIFIASGGSAFVALLYLVVNKKMNGLASGASRTLWWDDYSKLTNDFIESLLVEVTNIFHMQIPQFIEEWSFEIKVFVLVMLGALLVWFIAKNVTLYSRAGIMVTMAGVYFTLFTAIRLVSSMDTFYFRFWEPATFVLTLAILEIVVSQVRGKTAYRWFAFFVTGFVILSGASLLIQLSQNYEQNYYEKVCSDWDKAYAGIPQKSVVIFSELDFRSNWYRPDVVDGVILPEDTLVSIRERYYGSQQMCIRVPILETMVQEGDYQAEVMDELKLCLDQAITQNAEYGIIALEK